MIKTLAILCLTLSVAMSSHATDKLGGGPAKPWEALEQRLADQGLDATPSSLMSLARSSDDASIRWTAIEVLGLRRETVAEALLRELAVSERDPLLREAAALALARLGDEEGMALLRQALDSRQEASRRLYLAARLAELGDLTGYPYVVEATTAESAGRRAASVAPLVAFIPSSSQLTPDPISLLETLGWDEAAEVRREVLVHLPIVVEHGVETDVFCALVSTMAREDADREVREMAELYRDYGAFQACSGGEDETP